MPMSWPQFEVSSGVLVLSKLLFKCSKMQLLLILKLTLNIQLQHDLKCSVHDLFILFLLGLAFLFLFCVIFRNTLRSFEIYLPSPREIRFRTET